MRRSASTSKAPGRRDVLAAAAVGGTVLSSGCLRRIRSVTGWESRSQVSLDIQTVPADADPYALRLARAIASWFRAAGIDASVNPMSSQELLRSVLLEQNFDVFVGQLRYDEPRPDSLYPLVHSRFADMPGWQNPFGYANLDVDDQLDAQRRRSGDRRRAPLAAIQRSLARSQPLSTLAFPDEIRAVRADRYRGWDATRLRTARGYMTLEPARVEDSAGADGSGSSTQTTTRERAGTDRDGELRVVTTDSRLTSNLNPLSAEFRSAGVVTDLLYDSLGYGTANGEVRPWLAESWDVSTKDGRQWISLSLRDDIRWHDDAPITATDVAFTYDLIEDTKAEDDGETGEHVPVPAPRYQGRGTLVEDVVVDSTGSVEIVLTDCHPQVGLHALTVPILPEHVWKDRRSPASVSGIDFGPTTEAVVTDNVPPVGSGPLQFADTEPNRSLTLERNDHHFLVRDDPAVVPESVRAGPAFRTLTFQVVGSDSTAVDLVVEGEADATHTPVGASTVPTIARASDVELLVEGSRSPYIVGYNVRSQPLANERFRHTLGRLIDQSFLTDEVFDGYARPGASPLADTNWVPTDLRWDDEHPETPFIGEDGTVDTALARSAFEDAGFVYDQGALLQSD